MRVKGNGPAICPQRNKVLLIWTKGAPLAEHDREMVYPGGGRGEKSCLHLKTNNRRNSGRVCTDGTGGVVDL